MNPDALVWRFFCFGGEPACAQELPTIASGVNAQSE
jgi:hypothetical protein